MIKAQCICGAKYKLDEKAIGRRAKCKKCGEVFEVRPMDETPIGDVPAVGDMPGTESEGGEDSYFGGGFGLSDEISAATAKAKQPQVPQATAATYGLGAAAAVPGNEALHESYTEPQVGGGVDRFEPKVRTREGYGQALLWSLLFPTSTNNMAGLITFIILITIGEVLLLPFAGCLGLVGFLCIIGWYYAFLFGTISNAANGEDDLPSVTLTDGILDGILLPLLKYVFAAIVAFAPSLIYLLFLSDVLRWDTWTGGQVAIGKVMADEASAFLILEYAGHFAWPMVVLCVALGGPAAIGRPDLIVVSIVKTFPAYILTVLLSGTHLLVAYLLDDVVLNKIANGGTTGSLGFHAVFLLVTICVSTYLDIFAMRCIGLYYFYNKHRFAWNWG